MDVNERIKNVGNYFAMFNVHDGVVCLGIHLPDKWTLFDTQTICDEFAIQIKSKDIVKAYKSEKPEPVSRISVFGDKVASVAVNCRHCDDPACVKACITGAMTKDKKTLQWVKKYAIVILLPL